MTASVFVGGMRDGGSGPDTTPVIALLLRVWRMDQVIQETYDRGQPNQVPLVYTFSFSEVLGGVGRARSACGRVGCGHAGAVHGGHMDGACGSIGCPAACPSFV